MHGLPPKGGPAALRVVVVFHFLFIGFYTDKRWFAPFLFWREGHFSWSAFLSVEKVRFSFRFCKRK